MLKLAVIWSAYALDTAKATHLFNKEDDPRSREIYSRKMNAVYLCNAEAIKKICFFANFSTAEAQIAAVFRCSGAYSALAMRFSKGTNS